MSWLSAIKTGFSWLTGSSMGAGITRSVLMGLALNKLSNTTKNNPSSQDRPPEPDPGTKVQLNPDPKTAVPVLYGRRHLAGTVTEAVMTADRKTMWYVITLSEQTGNLLSTGIASSYLYWDAYWSDARIVWKSDGITVDYTVDREGNVNSSLADLVRVYVFNQDTQLSPDNYTVAGGVTARDLVPGWTGNHLMSDLIYAVVRVDYNKEKGVNSLGNLTFDLENSMSQPGDVLYDYMTNTRYGAGLAPEEIYSA